MQTRAKLGQFRKGGHIFRPHILGVRGNIAQTFKPRQAGHLAQQGGKACAVAAFVLPKGVDVLPKQGDFARAVVDQCLAFVNDCRAAARLLTATGKGHNAVRAKVVATLHNVGIGHGPIDNAGFGCGLALHILAGEIEQREALGGIFEQPFNGLRGIANAVAARHKAHLAFFFKDALAQLLGHATGHAHQYCRVAARNLTDAAKRAHNLLFRLFAHRTGIDHHHLRVFERRFKKTARVQRTPQPVGVVHVHLTAKRDDMVRLFNHDCCYCSISRSASYMPGAPSSSRAATRSSSQSSTARAVW